MPRPYGWIRGEGTVKNQRWGLGSIMDTPVIPSQIGFTGITIDPNNPGTMSNVDPLQGLSPDWYDQLVYGNSGPNAGLVSGSGQVLFSPISGGSTNWLLIGALAVGGILLLRR